MPNMTRKPREKPAPYKQHSETVTTRKNLTLNDWLVVFAYTDTHPHQSQVEIVLHLEKELTGALAFKLEARINSNPNALSSKRPRVVTRLDVEQALFTWVKHMEIKGDT
ncbi:hypothetical protein BD769DRAFT_1534860 [Suillus cothurnatus]|nr:hypothetical protein BD769DRAFT_1534860 [Suillus cothurnatus]